MRLIAVLLAIASPSFALAAADGSAEVASDERSDPLVVSGRPSVSGRWPDAAAMFVREQAAPSCSGVLVAPNLVLTARHCLVGTLDRVLIGATSWQQADGDSVRIVSVYVHPTLDVGLLVLERDSALSSRLIASGCVLERHLQEGAPVTIVGFGATDVDGQQISTVLREGGALVSDVDCSSSAGCLHSGSELAAVGLLPDPREDALGNPLPRIDSCNGDSGGPLYLNTEGYDYLVGVTSRGIDEGTTSCSQGGIYVRADALVDWIEEQAGVSIAQSDCEPVALEADSGEVGSKRIAGKEAPEGVTRRFDVVSQPAYGVAEVSDNGLARYQSDDGYLGPDSFMVRVIESGPGASSSVVSIEVEVVEGGGCRAASGSGRLALWMLVVGLLAIRRRR
ncbi:MAG: trypsin-like serine protease [Deltaproteobacteria bacterium]|nr:trypsin-like serine protease [Deltaproteobacteria bacterium]